MLKVLQSKPLSHVFISFIESTAVAVCQVNMKMRSYQYLVLKRIP